MTGLSTLISKYHHIQRSHQLGGIIGQLDKVAQLASEELGYITGEAINISGGLFSV